VSPVKKIKYSKFDNTQEWRELGFAVAYYRKLRGLTQETLAERVGITQANLSILKTNKARAVRFSTLEAICRELDCQPGDILEYREER